MKKNGEIIKVEAKATRRINRIGNKESIVKNQRKMRKNWDVIPKIATLALTNLNNLKIK